MVASDQVGLKMLDNLKKSLNFLGVDISNMEYKPCEKHIYSFDDPIVNKHWLAFLAFHRTGYSQGHRQGRIDELNEISIHAIKEIEKVK